MLTAACCLAVGLGLGLEIRFSVLLDSGYAHVFVPLSVVIVHRHPQSHWPCVTVYGLERLKR